MYTIGGSFWEFGEPDWERSRLLLMFGVAEDHDSNPIKIGLSKLKANGAKFISVNPVRTGYSAIADEWIGIRPGTDGLFVLALVHELLRAGSIDTEFLIRYTNAPWLVIQDEGGPENGLIARDDDGIPLCWDLRADGLSSALATGIAPALAGRYRLPDGRMGTPAFRTSRASLPAARIRTRRRRRDYRCASGNHPSDCRRARLHRVRGDGDDRAALDGLGRPSARADDRPPGCHACHAWHFRPLQRVPYLPGDSPPADAAWHDRCARRFPLQAAVSQGGTADAQAHGEARRGRLWRPDAGTAAGLPCWARRSAGACGWQSRPDRQGVLVGGAARRPRDDAHGHCQRLERRPLPRSTRCSSTWRT